MRRGRKGSKLRTGGRKGKGKARIVGNVSLHSSSTRRGSRGRF